LYRILRYWVSAQETLQHIQHTAVSCSGEWKSVANTC
jgi:hypothetical protein